MVEPPEGVYGESPWMFDCSEDYSGDPSTHESCVRLRMRRKLEAELEHVRRELRDLVETKLWLERAGVQQEKLLEIEREIGQLRIRKEEIERELAAMGEVEA
jgi:hypothetical protein